VFELSLHATRQRSAQTRTAFSFPQPKLRFVLCLTGKSDRDHTPAAYAPP